MAVRGRRRSRAGSTQEILQVVPPMAVVEEASTGPFSTSDTSRESWPTTPPLPTESESGIDPGPAYQPRGPDELRSLYGYDSDPTHFYKSKTNQMTISQHSRQLLQAVTNARADCSSRPLIFVAHILGGILVKDAIIESRKPDQQQDSKKVALSCVAIMFFDTPHQGAGAAKLGKIVSNLVSILPLAPSTSTKILGTLQPDSEKLEQVLLDFNGVLDQQASTTSQMQLYSFREGLEYSKIKGFDSKVVPDFSSFFGRRLIEKESFVMKNHIDMCKLALFDDAVSDTYNNAFVPAVRGYIGAIKERSKNADNEVASGLRRHFEYSGRLDRLSQLENFDINPASLDWIWTSVFATWLGQPEPIFWIRGEAASGKSTLILYIAKSKMTLQLLQSVSSASWVCIYHFFDFRADSRLANNFAGVLRSLILQILTVVPDIALNQTDLVSLRGLNKPEQSDVLSSIPVDVCRQSLFALLRGCEQHVLILLDGLDEYSGEYRSLIALLKGLGALQNVKVCFASRPMNLLDTAFENVGQLLMNEVNRPGIRAFAENLFRLEFENSRHVSHIDFADIVEDLTEKSQGVFLWAHFAVEQMITGLASGQDVTSSLLKKKLADVPPKLHDIYVRIVRKIPLELRSFAVLALLLSIHAIETISINLLRDAMQLVPELDGAFRDAKQIAEESYHDESFEKIVRESTGGLCEILSSRGRVFGTYSEMSAVRLIHRSVETYLQDYGWVALGVNSMPHVLADELWLNILATELQESTSTIKTITRGFNSSLPSPETDNVFQYYVPEIGVNDEDEAWTEDDNVSTAREGLVHDSGSSPLLVYVTSFVFDHAARYERNTAVSSYPLLRAVMTPNLAKAHSDLFRSGCMCQPLEFQIEHDWAAPSEAVHVAIGHRMYRYLDAYVSEGPDLPEARSRVNENRYVMENDTAILSSTAGQVVVWTRKEMALSWALEYAIFRPDPARSLALGVALQYDTNFSDLRLLNAIVKSTPAVVESLLSVHKPRAFTARLNREWQCHSTLIKSKLLLNGATTATFRPFWGVGRRNIVGTAAIIDHLKDAGEDINGICGPFGTVLHSFMDNTPERPSRFKDKVFDLLLAKGANLHVVGPYGNVLEFLWWRANCRCWEESYRCRFRRLFKRLIEAGAVNSRPGPDGVIPTRDEMLNWGPRLSVVPIYRCRGGRPALGT